MNNDLQIRLDILMHVSCTDGTARKSTHYVLSKLYFAATAMPANCSMWADQIILEFGASAKGNFRSLHVSFLDFSWDGKYICH